MFFFQNIFIRSSGSYCHRNILELVVILATLVNLANSNFALAEETNTPASVTRHRYNAWTLSLGSSTFQYEDEFGPYRGYAGLFAVGFWRIENRFLWGGDFDILLGPYTKIRHERIRTDFYGTGLTARFCYGFSSMRAGGSFLSGIGLNYSDMSGKSVTYVRTNDGEISDLSVRISNFGALATIGYAEFYPARIVGNTPDLLTTRIEGYSLFFDAVYPLRVTQKTSYSLSKRDENGIVTEQNERTGRGVLDGYTLQLVFSVYLGV